jgi:hypothetical protein
LPQILGGGFSLLKHLISSVFPTLSPMALTRSLGSFMIPFNPVDGDKWLKAK